MKTPPRSRLAALTACGVVVFASMGASCSPKFASPFGVTGPPAPVVLAPTSSTAEIVAAVNANTARVQTYQAPQASVSLPQSAGLPLVSAPIAVERPLRFRLRGTTALTGPEIDLGSNDERFWIWARRNEPPSVYTARHDLWATSPVRNQVPIEPAWLIEALGLVELDPNATYVGPVPRGDGSIEMRTQVTGPAGAQTRVIVVDAQSAVVREQHVYDAAGTLTASAIADRFRYDAASQASLPERIRVSVPAAGMEFTIKTGAITVNAPIADGGQLWSVPNLGDYPVVDLTAPGGYAATPEGPWDLAGTGATYGAPPSIATPYAPTPAASPWASEPIAAAPVANQRPAAPPTVTSPPITPQRFATLPESKPATSDGFVGLPVGGRALP